MIVVFGYVLLIAIRSNKAKGENFFFISIPQLAWVAEGNQIGTVPPRAVPSSAGAWESIRQGLEEVLLHKQSLAISTTSSRIVLSSSCHRYALFGYREGKLDPDDWTRVAELVQEGESFSSASEGPPLYIIGLTL